MGDYMSELPTDILCNILSSLTVRDAFRVKSLSLSWKDLPDTRSLLHFDRFTIFGRESPISGDNFVIAVEQFFKIWRAEKATSLKIKYCLGGEYRSEIDRWIAVAIGKEIEEFDLDFSSDTRTPYGEYAFPCHLLDTDYLKHLRLAFCMLTMVCDASTRWLSKLRTLELKNVPLCLRDVECILSSSPNLESLRFTWEFKTDEPVIIQHPSLKKLVILFLRNYQVELSCPQLEKFEFSGYCCEVKFSKVPLLKEASLTLFFRHGGCSYDFTGLAKNGPLLQSLSLLLSTEVEQLPPNVTMSFLKRLHLLVKRRRRLFDLFTIVHYLGACPVLEEFILKVDSTSRLRHVEERRYIDRPHFHLKEVKIEGVMEGKISTGEVIEYLLRNGVSLQRMIFIVRTQSDFDETCMHLNCSMWQTINPVVKLVLERTADA